MRIVLASGSPAGRRKAAPTEALLEEYRERIARYCPCETRFYDGEGPLLAALEQRTGRVPSRLIAMDGGGRMVTSADFAALIRGLRDNGAQQVVVAVGPPDGWSKEALARADETVSLGRITLPQGLARVVVAEQVYRAMTILAGHPYHCGH